MWPASNDLLLALSQSHEMVTRVSVFSGSTSKGDISIVDGSVSATLNQQVCRSASLTVDRSITDAGILDPLSDQVFVRLGVKGGVEEVPIFVGRVVSHNVSSSGQVSVQCADRGRDIVKALFEVPWAVSAGAEYREAISDIIQDVDAMFGVDVSDMPPLTAPALVWEQERGDALDKLAGAINSIWQPDRTGGFIGYRNPYNIAPPVPSVGFLQDGADGVVVSREVISSRDEMCNAVTVIVERTDGTAPIRVTAKDLRTTSPTRWGGPFGKQNKIVKTQAPLTTSGAELVAQRILRQLLGIGRTWTIATPHYPIFDPGDVLTVVLEGETTQQVVQSVTYPLAPTGTGVLSTQELYYEFPESFEIE